MRVFRCYFLIHPISTSRPLHPLRKDIRTHVELFIHYPTPRELRMKEMYQDVFIFPFPPISTAQLDLARKKSVKDGLKLTPCVQSTSSPLHTSPPVRTPSQIRLERIERHDSVAPTSSHVGWKGRNGDHLLVSRGGLSRKVWGRVGRCLVNFEHSVRCRLTSC